MYTLFGIPNCNTVKKARTWLDEHRVAHQFHNYKTEGIAAKELTEWCRQVGWQKLVNQKGTTWRGLDEATKAAVTNQTAAVKLMAEHNSVIKRPVMTKGHNIVAIGFDEAEYGQVFL
ncbi:MAG: ArsC family reductase [Edaphocola sp.]